MSAKTVYLIRHATPDWNRKDIRYDIPPGPPLVDHGRREARLSAAFLESQGIQAVYTSPMDRAAETAAIIAEILGLPVRPARTLTEWMREESVEQVRARLLDFWQTHIEGADEARIALVSHGGPVAALIEHFQPSLDLNPYRARFDHRNCVPPAGIWRASRTTAHQPWRWALVFTPVLPTSRNGHQK